MKMKNKLLLLVYSQRLDTASPFIVAFEKAFLRCMHSVCSLYLFETMINNKITSIKSK